MLCVSWLAGVDLISHKTGASSSTKVDDMGMRSFFGQYLCCRSHSGGRLAITVASTQTNKRRCIAFCWWSDLSRCVYRVSVTVTIWLPSSSLPFALSALRDIGEQTLHIYMRMLCYAAVVWFAIRSYKIGAIKWFKKVEKGKSDTGTALSMRITSYMHYIILSQSIRERVARWLGVTTELHDKVGQRCHITFWHITLVSRSPHSSSFPLLFFLFC